LGHALLQGRSTSQRSAWWGPRPTKKERPAHSGRAAPAPSPTGRRFTQTGDGTPAVPATREAKTMGRGCGALRWQRAKMRGHGPELAGGENDQAASRPAIQTGACAGPGLIPLPPLRWPAPRRSLPAPTLSCVDACSRSRTLPPIKRGRRRLPAPAYEAPEAAGARCEAEAPALSAKPTPLLHLTTHPTNAGDVAALSRKVAPIPVLRR
jgi:hypothetical protein